MGKWCVSNGAGRATAAKTIPDSKADPGRHCGVTRWVMCVGLRPNVPEFDCGGPGMIRNLIAGARTADSDAGFARFGSRWRFIEGFGRDVSRKWFLGRVDSLPVVRCSI